LRRANGQSEESRHIISELILNEKRPKTLIHQEEEEEEEETKDFINFQIINRSRHVIA
jgi:hypothetical protein